MHMPCRWLNRGTGKVDEFFVSFKVLNENLNIFFCPQHRLFRSFLTQKGNEAKINQSYQRKWFEKSHSIHYYFNVIHSHTHPLWT